ncbi:MAG: YaiI/YqxD family protein [Ruminococcaceae bacterium]|nr:YaiI/YqxD family protein [Oscillospiraceae bacterium]
MRILIDADGCPVVDTAVKLARKYKLECIIFCDTAHFIEQPGARVVIVPTGADSVDFKLVNELLAGDIVITQDYGLAAMSLAKKAVPVSQNGLVFTNENIDSLLHARHTARNIRRSGGRLKGPKKRTSEQDKAFIETMHKLIQAEIDN